MAINWKALDARAKDFNDKYHTGFSYSAFHSKLKTFERLDPKNAATIVYKGTLGAVLKDTLIIACNTERNSRDGKSGAVDLMIVVKDFEEYLMKPFVQECKREKEKPYPKSYGGMNIQQRVELVEHVLQVAPKNDVTLTEQAYMRGQIRLRDMRESVKNMPFAIGGKVDRAQIQRIGTFMLAIENVNKERSSWWRFFHPFRNNAEQRDAKELRTLLNSFGDGVLDLAKSLAAKEYKTLELTRESLNNAKAEIENEKNADKIRSVESRDSIKIDLDGKTKEDVSKKIDGNEKEQPVTIKKQ
jgi:hypothetical protein